jgi:hypothetical protein
MQALRNASFLVRLVLAWFALSIGVAMASPLVKTQAFELICSGGAGMQLLDHGDQDGAPAAGPTLDCPMCASLASPPAKAQGVMQATRPQGHVVPSNLAPRIAALTATPPPARGPPLTPLMTL